MSFNFTPNAKIVEDSSRIQQSITDRFENNGLSPFIRTNFFDSLKQTGAETMQRHIDSRRHPMTGVSGPRSKTSPYRPSTIARDIIRQTHKLNPRILETWLNSTVADAEHFEVPVTVLKQENKLPLARYGIDRSSLLSSGLPTNEIDRLYQSLFVHSIGFYQLILKVLEHTEKKYTIITGIWKVFAILLEYCCQLDYKMIISTLDLEKREELEQLENEHKIKISKMEEFEKSQSENIINIRNQLKNVQKDLQKEIEKREELEDELLQRGSGHEEEVTMRLLFESKLNQMYAKQRDMTTKLEQLNEVVNDQQKLIDLKSEMVNKEKKRANDMIQGKIEIEQEMKKMEEKQKQYEVVNANLEGRLDESLLKIEELNTEISKSHMDLTELMNDIAQKRITIDDQRFEINVNKVQLTKVENLLKEYAVEKQMYIERIANIEKTYSDEFTKNKFYEQEYAKVKESDNVSTIEYLKYKKRCEELEALNDILERERDGYKVSLDSNVEQSNELKNQVKRSQEKIEEMNRGRRVVEELNENLKLRLSEKINDLQELRKQITDNRTEIDSLKSHEAELEGDVSSLQIKLKSLEKQFETTKETLQEKINNLNDILSSEKKIRENWIYRYEDEQKSHAKTTKDLITTEDKLNDATMKINSLTISVEEKTALIEKYALKNKDQLEEILALKSLEEEYARKNKTLSILIANIETSSQAKINEIYVDIEEMKLDQLREIERKSLLYEELWDVARKNLALYLNNCEEAKKLQKIVEEKDKEISKAEKIIEEKNALAAGKYMIITELEMYIIKQSGDMDSKAKEFEDLRVKLFNLNREHEDFLNKIPVNLRGEKNPFIVLEDQIDELNDKIKEMIAAKENFNHQETQYCYEKDSKDIYLQTEIDLGEFERLISSNKNKVVDMHDQFAQSSIPDIGKNPSLANMLESGKDFPLRKKITSEEAGRVESRKTLRQQSADSIQREEETLTPVNLKSIYKHEDEEAEESKQGVTTKLPLIGKKLQQVRPPTMPLQLTSEIKRHIKQANSRRKNDTLFS